MQILNTNDFVTARNLAPKFERGEALTSTSPTEAKGLYERFETFATPEGVQAVRLWFRLRHIMNEQDLGFVAFEVGTVWRKGNKLAQLLTMIGCPADRETLKRWHPDYLLGIPFDFVLTSHICPSTGDKTLRIVRFTIGAADYPRAWDER